MVKDGPTVSLAKTRKKAGLAEFAGFAGLAAMVLFMLLMASFQWTVDSGQMTGDGECPFC
jgi:hypothetical protein